MKTGGYKTLISKFSLPLVLAAVIAVFGSISPLFLSVSNIR